ncbi:MAG: hypothetical protein V4864_11640 [Pseudomonadota bacterium]
MEIGKAAARSVSMPAISDRARQFIATSVPSVPWVEALLILRAHPRQAWNAPSLAPRLYLPVAQAQELLRALCDAGIAVHAEPAAFRYQPPDALRPVLDEVAWLYATSLVEVTQIIHDSLTLRPGDAG